MQQLSGWVWLAIIAAAIALLWILATRLGNNRPNRSDRTSHAYQDDTTAPDANLVKLYRRTEALLTYDKVLLRRQHITIRNGDTDKAILRIDPQASVKTTKIDGVPIVYFKRLPSKSTLIARLSEVMDLQID